MINWPKVDKFLSPDEIVGVLFKRVKGSWAAKEFIESDPISFHHYWGTAIRNEFHLWHPGNPYTMKDYVPELRDGVDYNPRHADNMSGYIMKQLHARLSGYLK